MSIEHVLKMENEVPILCTLEEAEIKMMKKGLFGGNTKKTNYNIYIQFELFLIRIVILN